MAFSIASGLTPQAGIYCAIVTGFLISLLGGSKTQIGGPTGAFVVVVAGIVAVHGVDGLFMCTVMAGILLVILGITGMGTAVKFIPRPVVIGFTNGIAVLIASTQVKDFFGLRHRQSSGRILAAHGGAGRHFPPGPRQATILAAATVAVMILCRAVSNRIPGPIVAMLWRNRGRVSCFTCRSKPLAPDSAESPAGCRTWSSPLHADLVHGLLGPAFTVAMLGAIESLMSAVVSDRMSNDRHNPNVELVGAGRRQHRLADVRGPARHRRHRPHRDQHPLRSAVAGRGHDSLLDPALHSAVCRAAGAALFPWRRWPAF